MNTTIYAIKQGSSAEVFFYNGYWNTREANDLITVKGLGHSTIFDGWKVREIDGIGPVETEIFSEAKGAGDGVIITGSRQTERHIDIVARQVEGTNYEKRAEAIKFHNPENTYDICITYLGQTRWIQGCTLEAFSIPATNVGQNQEITVSFLCPDSYYGTIFESVSDLYAKHGVVLFTQPAGGATIFNDVTYIFDDEFIITAIGEGQTDEHGDRYWDNYSLPFYLSYNGVKITNLNFVNYERTVTIPAHSEIHVKYLRQESGYNVWSIILKEWPANVEVTHDVGELRSPIGDMPEQQEDAYSFFQVDPEQGTLEPSSTHISANGSSYLSEVQIHRTGRMRLEFARLINPANLKIQIIYQPDDGSWRHLDEFYVKMGVYRPRGMALIRFNDWYRDKQIIPGDVIEIEHNEAKLIRDGRILYDSQQIEMLTTYDKEEWDMTVGQDNRYDYVNVYSGNDEISSDDFKVRVVVGDDKVRGI